MTLFFHLARGSSPCAGGARSGKITQANAILAEMVCVALQDRMVIWEDIAEIERAAAQKLTSLHTSGSVDGTPSEKQNAPSTRLDHCWRGP